MRKIYNPEGRNHFNNSTIGFKNEENHDEFKTERSIFTDIKLNKYGVNLNIKAHILSDQQMRNIGFTDCNNERWYFIRRFKAFKSDRLFTNVVGFSVSINKEYSDDLRIDVLDEDFCQPYDYQYILERNPESETALKVQTFVEEWMDYLQNKGVLSGHNNGEYI